MEAIYRGITVTELLEQALEAELTKNNDKTFHNMANELPKRSNVLPAETMINPLSGDTGNTLKIGPAYEGSLEQLSSKVYSATSGTTFTNNIQARRKTSAPTYQVKIA